MHERVGSALHVIYAREGIVGAFTNYFVERLRVPNNL